METWGCGESTAFLPVEPYDPLWIDSGLLSRFVFLVKQTMQFIQKLFNIVKVTVYTDKPDISNVIELLKPSHDFFTNTATLYLFFTALHQVSLNVHCDTFDHFRADRAFLTSLLNASNDFLSIEQLPTVVFFDDDGQKISNLFIGGKSSTTMFAKSAPTNDHTIPFAPRINDFGFVGVTKWTSHDRLSFLFSWFTR